MKYPIRNKIILEVRPFPEWDGKDWVEIHFLNTNPPLSWIPSFEELYHILKRIGECEDKKYPLHHHQGKIMTLNFVYDIFHTNKTYEELALKYKIHPRSIKRELI